MGDGSSVYDGASGSETAAWVSLESTGTISFRQCYFANWKDNAVYASAPGGGNGPVVIDRCFAANNNHADYRIGSSESVVKDSVVLHDRDTATCRGIWCWYNTGLEVQNCHVDTNGQGAAIHAGPYEPGGVNVSDSEYDGALVEDGAGSGEITFVSGNGTSPDVTVPDGVPQSAEKAASGSSSDGGEEQSSFFEHSLRVDTDDGARLVDYEFVTSGEATHGSEAEASDEVTENDDGTWAIRGVVSNGHADSFEFEGEILDVSLSNPATVLVDGSEHTSA